MALLAEKPIETIGLAEIAKGAGVSLSDLRGAFGSTLAILAAYVKRIDRAVLAGGDADMAEEPPRERLFDVLMRRLELLAPHKAAVRSLMRSAGRNPGLAFACTARAALAAMDAHRRRHRRRRSARLRARAGARAVVRVGAAHLGRRRRSGPRPHHGGARPRARARPALVGLARRALPDSRLRAACARGGAAAASDEETYGDRWRPYAYTGTRTVARKPPSGLSDKDDVAAVGAGDVAGDREPEAGAASS
jgi:AcrR family transcriptional regulator